MIVAIHQPQYLPWLGYLDKIRLADGFCYLDSVQYKKNEWQNRNRIKTPTGWQWLTVPVNYRFGQKINQVAIDNGAAWRRKHLQALRTSYGRTPHFNRYFERFEDLYRKPWATIDALNIDMIESIRSWLGLVDKPVFRSSQMHLPDEPTARLIAVCKTLGADTYLAGAGAVAYMDLDQFRHSGIEVISQRFVHPVYPQPFGAFEPNLSVVDLLFNCGPDSLKVIAEANSL